MKVNTCLVPPKGNWPLRFENMKTQYPRSGKALNDGREIVMKDGGNIVY